MTSLFIQSDTITDSIQTPISETKTLSIFELISSGGIGGSIIMGTLGLLSIVAIYILFERYSAIKKASKEDENFLKSIRNFVEAKDIEAAKIKRAKEAEAEKKAEEKTSAVMGAFGSLAQKKDNGIEGHSDPNFKPHAILPNSVHAHHVDNIDSVAGPEVTDKHNSETVHRSAMEGGEPLPERRRDIVTKGYNPSFDPQKEASTVPASSGDAAEAENKAKGDAIKAKDAADKAA